MPPLWLARMAGLLYLLVGVLGGSSATYLPSVVVDGNAAATAENIRAGASLVRLAFTADLVHIACLVGLAFALYALLAPIGARIAATFVVLNAVAATIMGVNLVNHAGALLVATDPAYAAAFGAGTADALALLFLDLHARGFAIAQVFFALWLLPLGYLVYASGFLPRVLGILLMLGCFAYLAQLVAIFAAPDFAAERGLPLALAAGLTEVMFLGWLLVKGVRSQRHAEQLPAAL
jgi:hypothetical protein